MPISFLFRFALSTVVLVCVLAFGAMGQGATTVPHQVIVQLKHGRSVDHMLERIHSEMPGSGIYVSQNLSRRINIWLLQFDTFSGTDVEMLDYLRKRPEIEIAQFNHNNIEQRVLPNDSDFSIQWSLFNDGINGGSGLADIDAENAWEITTGGVTAMGDTIVVAVIDGNFDLTHEDLNLFKNHHDSINGIDDDGNGYLDDFDGWNAYDNNNSFSGFAKSHGTHVSGIIGARGNNGLGISGVNWNVKVLPIRGSSTLEAPVIAAYAYALEMRMKYNETNGDSGAYIVVTNSSFGANYGQPSAYPIWCAMYDTLGEAGIVNVGATANINIDVDVSGDIPTKCPSNYFIGTTATTSSDARLNSAAYGPYSIDLGAPGDNIYSTDATNGYGYKTGTSMATPLVSGAVALMYANLCGIVIQNGYQRPDSLAGDVIDALLNKGTDPISDLTGATTTGGRLNLFEAVKAAGEIPCYPLSSDSPFINTTPNWSVYPNPAAGAITVSFSEAYTAGQLEVFNVLGELVYSAATNQSKVSLPAELWPTGLYLVSWLPKDGPTQTQRVIVE